MRTVNVLQGSAEWLALRAKYPTASEAPSIFGEGYNSRDALLRQKKTGISPEVTPALQKLFDKGHATEALARPIAESIIDEMFYPVTGVDDGDEYLASFDGLTLAQDIVFEHKLLNQKVIAMIEANELSPRYYWQLEQQLMVSGAERALFVCSDGTDQNFHHMFYSPVDGRREQLIAGWAQFYKDLEEYEVTEEVVIEKTAILELPALAVKTEGQLTIVSNNLPVYQSQVETLIAGLKDDLETDEDFAKAEDFVKFFKKSEEKLEAGKEALLAETGSIADVVASVNHIQDIMRTKRLAYDKLVKSKKTAVKASIISDAEVELGRHLMTLNESLNGVLLPPHSGDLAGAIKGKRTMSSIHDAVDTEVARVKVEASTQHAALLSSCKKFDQQVSGVEFLFTDKSELVRLDKDHMVMVINARIEEYSREQNRKQEEQDTADKAEIETKQDWVGVTPASRSAASETVDPVIEPTGDNRQYNIGYCAALRDYAWDLNGELMVGRGEITLADALTKVTE